MDEIDELVTFLRRQLDEDEAAVYRWDSDARSVVATLWTGDEPGYTTVASSHDGDCWIADGHEVVPSREPRVLFDPAQVLREIEGKRRIIETAELMLDGGVIYESWESVLQDLALPFDSRPGYRPEWKP